MSGFMLGSYRLARPSSVGAPVNNHVVPIVHQPEPDYAALQRLVSGSESLPDLKHDERESGRPDRTDKAR